jgi:hypothetical protein
MVSGSVKTESGMIDFKCECASKEVKTAVQTLEEKIKNCGKCKDGYTSFRNLDGMWEEKKCVCIINFKI